MWSKKWGELMTDARWIEGEEIKKVMEKIRENIVEPEIKLFQEKEVAKGPEGSHHIDIC